MWKSENSKTLHELARHVWPHMQAAGYTCRVGDFYHPDGKKMVIRWQLGPLIRAVCADLNTEEWEWALAHCDVTHRVYQLRNSLREVAKGLRPIQP